MSMQNLLDEYQSWLDKSIEPSQNWVEELEFVSFQRGLIHDQIVSAGSISDGDTKRLRTLDARWQASLAVPAHTFHLEHDREAIPKSSWWHWIDQIESLTAEELSTL